ncbi:type III secretion low calcium response chaperone LcrH/SycD [Chlamydia ibidis]|uniref:Type III secretion low calcium response chaperone LcrH/SycD n=2 Tax=Chlamydia ibidis TaxID=1405396 RepID=S7J3I2_9CHLA|nr:SycD/LcrH family type III secretion system chaperone [Chlamydia ibidis]EPP34587.1 type III secretion low calcium response chaperone LcrH/SycD [Chlamydia ibidis]EQM62500.1 type III secretion low calcium response chaperone LcrH/SycD [Chlamydia ibidis 10-1398/6]
MSYLTYLLERIAHQSQEDFPFPDDLENYLRGFFPDKGVPLDTYQKVFKIPSEDLEKVYKEGYNLYLDKKYEESISVFRWLVFFNPFISKFWFSLGASLHMSGEYSQALHAYGVTALLRDKDPYPHYYAYICYTLIDDKEEADKALESAWERSKHHPAYAELKEEILNIKNCSEH